MAILTGRFLTIVALHDVRRCQVKEAVTKSHKGLAVTEDGTEAVLDHEMRVEAIETPDGLYLFEPLEGHEVAVLPGPHVRVLQCGYWYPER